MKRKRKKKLVSKHIGFSLVELLAVIVILGLLSTIGITAISSLIDRTKSEKMISQKNTVKMAAQSYIQDNKNLVPKLIGDTKNIPISELKKSKYIVDNIENNKGESCMEKSYVRIYKLSKNKYTYDVYLYCGDEEVPEEEIVPAPVITAKFSDSTGEIKDEKLNNVSDAYLYIEINAATDGKLRDYKSQNNPIFIDGYSFTISSNGKEAYNSGSLSAGRKEKIIINKKLKDYIDVAKVTEVSVEVTAFNTLGGKKHSHETISERGNVDTSKYHDKVKPKCIQPDDPYNEGDWLNKSEYYQSKRARKLTVGCEDGTGSQCIRNYFTKSWPNDENEDGAEYVYVDVEDNAGNKSERNNECKFRVNVDIQTPSATVTAFEGLHSNSNETSALASKTTGSNILTEKINASDSNTMISVKDKYYNKIVGNNTEIKWMNQANYPQGVIYKIELKDNIRLDHWTWNTNAGYIDSKNSAEYTKVTGTNPEASNGTIAQDAAHGATAFHGSTKDTVYVRFLTEGMRYGEFTVYDKAGNSIKIEIAANLDRTAPPVPETLNAYVYNKERTQGTKVSTTAYSFGTWTNRYVRVQTGAGQDIDNLSNNVTLSGFWQYYYDARNNSNIIVGSRDYSTYTSGVGLYDFKGTAAEVDGKNKIKFKGCDKAGNCSNWSSYREEWIDITVPTCTVKKTITSGAESKYYWLGINETAKVTASCSDQTSGCTVNSFQHDYNYQINTTTAGAKGNNNGGSFTDNAGNTVNCASNQRIQIDYENPKCKVTGGSEEWINKTSSTQSRTITATCSDTGGSKCATEPFSMEYSKNIYTGIAGAKGDGEGGYVLDKADNKTDCEAKQIVKIDKNPPKCKVTGGSEEWINKTSPTQSRTITASCSDTGGSECATADFSKEYSENIDTKKAGAIDVGEGGKVKDHAGNITDCEAKQIVKIDKNPPTCSVSGGSEKWTNKSVIIKGTCYDKGGSGCRGNISYEYKEEINTTVAGAAGDNKGGTVYDNAGNLGFCAEFQTVKIDKTAPECSVSGGSDSWTNKSVTINATCSDKGGSKCSTSEFSKTYSEDINTTSAGAKDVDEGGEFSDNAGNTVTCPMKTVRIDKTAPSCSIETSGDTNSDGNYKSDVTVSLKYSDSSSGVAGYGISSSNSTDYNGKTSTTAKDNGDYAYYGFVKDNVGNTNSCSKSFKIQKYSCDNGTLTYDESKGGYICVKDADASYEAKSWTTLSCNAKCDTVLEEYSPGKLCIWCWIRQDDGKNVCSCPTSYGTVYSCDAGWTKFTDGSHIKCYKLADSGTKQQPVTSGTKLLPKYNPNNPEDLLRWRQGALGNLKGTE